MRGPHRSSLFWNSRNISYYRRRFELLQNYVVSSSRDPPSASRCSRGRSGSRTIPQGRDDQPLGEGVPMATVTAWTTLIANVRSGDVCRAREALKQFTTGKGAAGGEHGAALSCVCAMLNEAMPWIVVRTLATSTRRMTRIQLKNRVRMESDVALDALLQQCSVRLFLGGRPSCCRRGCIPGTRSSLCSPYPRPPTTTIIIMTIPMVLFLNSSPQRWKKTRCVSSHGGSSAITPSVQRFDVAADLLEEMETLTSEVHCFFFLRRAACRPSVIGCWSAAHTFQLCNRTTRRVNASASRRSGMSMPL